jgi:signal transduction histidine kinase
MWASSGSCRPRPAVRNQTLRRAGPVAVVGLALAFGALSVGYAWVVARHLRDDARDTTRLLGRVFAGLNDPRPDAAADALLDLARQVRALGVPIAVTDTAGRVTATANAPFDDRADSATVHAWVTALDRVNAPLVQPGVGTIHYGALPVARRFTLLAALEGGVLLCLVVLAVWAYRWRMAAEGDRLWVAMARESAHQLGTPLMSLTGWIAYLRDQGMAGPDLVTHLEADTERLQRVARRFERTGRPARREQVGLGAVAERVVEYFRPRLPTLANPVRLTLTASGPGPTALGDPVLLEWALEALVKNAIDALSGQGGQVAVQVELHRAAVRVSVTDDGPGVPADVRRRLFQPGVSTKPGGWGIGLALARRIVEQQHGGRLTYAPGAGGRGSVFALDLPLAPAA